MSPEIPESSYEPALKLDYDLKAPGFFSYVRGTLRTRLAKLEESAVSGIFDGNRKNAAVSQIRTVWKTFEDSVSAAENVADRKLQSRALTAAVDEFNRSVKSVESLVFREIRAQASRGEPRPDFSVLDDAPRLRTDDALRFLDENGM